MYKAIIYSDVHFSQFSSILRKPGEKYSDRLHNLIDSISWAEHLADRFECDEVLCLGDFFDQSTIKAIEITALQEVYFSKASHRFLTGNHEANVASLDFSTTQIFQSLDADIISDVKRVEINDKVDFYFIPFMTSDAFKPLSSYLNNDTKKKVVFTHNVLAGINYGKFTSTTGFGVEEIKRSCNLFIDGHLHNCSVIDNKIVIAGNLTGLNFNEDAFKYRHNAYLITVNDDGLIKLETFENPYAYNFYKVYINNEEDVSVLNNIGPNAVLSISCQTDFRQLVEEAIKTNKSIREYKIIEMYNKYIGPDEDFESFKTGDHLKQFIEYVQTKIDSSPILSEELILIGGNS